MEKEKSKPMTDEFNDELEVRINVNNKTSAVKAYARLFE